MRGGGDGESGEEAGHSISRVSEFFVVRTVRTYEKKCAIRISRIANFPQVQSFFSNVSCE